jgi:hypothetical protein
MTDATAQVPYSTCYDVESAASSNFGMVPGCFSRSKPRRLSSDRNQGDVCGDDSHRPNSTEKDPLSVSPSPISSSSRALRENAELSRGRGKNGVRLVAWDHHHDSSERPCISTYFPLWERAVATASSRSRWRSEDRQPSSECPRRCEAKKQHIAFHAQWWVMRGKVKYRGSINIPHGSKVA